MISAKILKTFLDTHRLEILLTSNATLTKEMSPGRCPRKMGKLLFFLLCWVFCLFCTEKKRQVFYDILFNSFVCHHPKAANKSSVYISFMILSSPSNSTTKASLFEWCGDRSEVYWNGVFQYVHEIWADRTKGCQGGTSLHELASMKRTKTPLKIDNWVVVSDICLYFSNWVKTSN